MAHPTGVAWHKCLRVNRNDFGAFALPKSTCCRTCRCWRNSGRFFVRWAKTKPTKVGLIFGAPNRTRTCNLCLRRATHYPVVLWVHVFHIIYYNANIANIKSSKSPSRTAAESVFSTFVRTSLTN